MLADCRELVESWPPTMIVHGDLDAIVPVEHSFHFLSSLVLSDTIIDPGAISLTTISGEESLITDKVIENSTHYDSLSGITSDKLSASYDDNSNSNIVNSGGTIRSDVYSNFNTESKNMNSSSTVNTPLIKSKSTEWKMRPQDVIITIPGAKHSFEAVGGETLDIVCAGVMKWLSRINSKS